MRFKYALVLLLSLFLLSACVPDVIKQNEAGNAHFEDEAYTEALDAYRLAQVAEPDLSEPYYNAANAYNRQGLAEGALAQTQQALKNATPELAAQAWYNLGNAYFDAQQWQTAIEAYKESLRLTSSDVDAKYNLELALRAFAEQQEQEQQDQEQQEQDQEQSEQEGATPTPQNDAGEQESEDAQEDASQQQSAGEETQGMTPEQAQQLLEAVLGDSETLQERLRQIYQVPLADPEEDW